MKRFTQFGHDRWINVLLLLIPFALFLYRLDAQSLWYDEAVSARLATMPIPALIHWTAADIQPPLYYILLHFWQGGVGTSEWALRFFSATWAYIAVVMGYVLALRLTGNVRVARLTTLLLGFAPWMVYYAQETRMYTMLIALSMALAYVALDMEEAHQKPWRHAFRLSVLALLILYTHYFGLFLLVTFALWHLFIVLTQIRHRSRLLNGPSLLLSWGKTWGGTALIVGIGYAPWVPYLVRRLHVDASYWHGTLKLGEALRHWFIHMTLGAPETFLESRAVLWLPVLLAVTGCALLCHLLFLVDRGREQPLDVQHLSEPSSRGKSPAMVFLLMWLLFPTIFIFALAYRTPKFNPRYLMIVYPAWILILTTALAPNKGFHPSQSTHHLPRLTLVLPILVLPFFLWADFNWFTDPAFTKPDFRGALHYIVEHRTPEEPLILVSGHMSPVVDYYAPGLPYLRLPDIDVLDVNQVLDFAVARPMNRFLAGHPGVWLLLWQDEVVDPMGVVPFLLSRVGTEDSQVPNAFWHVRVRHYQLPPTVHVPETPPITYPASVNWGNQVEFLGVTEGKGSDVYLFFRARTALRADYRIHVEVWDEQGHMWGQGDTRPGPYLYPTFRWKPDQIVMGHHNLPTLPGTPAGDYTLRIRLYSAEHPDGLDILDQFGNPQGRDAVIPSVPLFVTRPYTNTQPPLPWPPLPPRLQGKPTTKVYNRAPRPAPFDILAARVIPSEPYEPGQAVDLQVAWLSSRPPGPNDVVTGSLIRPGQPPTPLGRFSLARYDTTSWPHQGVFFTQWKIRIPQNIPPGLVDITFTYVDRRTGRVHPLPFGFQWHVKQSHREFTVPMTRYPVDAVFGHAIRLVGVDMTPHTWQGGLTVPITLTWQALTEVDRSYTTFVHLLGPDGRVIAQEDHIPARGAKPTDEWIKGEVVRDRYDLALPSHLPSPLTLEIGVYDPLAPGMPRLPVTQGPNAGSTAVRMTVR